MFKRQFTIQGTEIVPPHDFQFQLDHYVLSPDFREDDQLIQIVPLKSGRVTRVAVSSLGTTECPKLQVEVVSQNAITDGEVEEVRALVSRHLCLQEDLKPFYELVRADKVLQASIDLNYGAKDKASIDMFHALIDCACAQNVIFKRLYSMLINLTQRFGSKVALDGVEYRAFPTARQLAEASIEDIRACKVGYRDKAIQGIAAMVAHQEVNLTQLNAMSNEDARNELMKLPSVGPYTADLALIVGGRRIDILHLDLFVREALWQFYLGGERVADKQLRQFAQEQWGKYQSYAGLYLTTNTEIWAETAGFQFRLKSGAKQ